MNFIYPDDLTEKNINKILCIDSIGDLCTIDTSELLEGFKNFVGELVWFAYILSDKIKEYKSPDGSLFLINEYPDAASCFDGAYNLGNEPSGYMRMPNLENGQLFLRQCSDSLPLGTISMDTFKRHKHSYNTKFRNIDKIHINNNQYVGARPGETAMTGGNNENDKFNETAMKNVVLKPYIRMLP